MDHAAHRPLLAAAALTTAGALTLAPITIAPNDIHAPSGSAARISTQAVQLTDAWSDLLFNTASNIVVLGEVFAGANNAFPLPNPTIFVAPVATQLVLNPLIYAVQLITGQGGKIPTEIATHLSKLADLALLIVSDLPAIIVQQIQTPFVAAKLALDSIATATNKLAALLEAPAVFLDNALNSQYGLVGGQGPIAVSIIVRNLLATAIATPLPTVVLPFKKASRSAAKTPAPTAATVTAPSGTAGSARTKPKTPSSASASAKKTGVAKAGDARGGTGHGKR